MDIFLNLSACAIILLTISVFIAAIFVLIKELKGE